MAQSECASPLIVPLRARKCLPKPQTGLRYLRLESVRHDLRHVPELPQQGEVRHLETQTAAVHPDRAETARRHPARVRPPACPQAERLVDADRNRRGSARRRARERDGAPRPENPRRLTLNRKRNRAARSLATRFSHAAERRGFEPLKPIRGLLAANSGALFPFIRPADGPFSG